MRRLSFTVGLCFALTLAADADESDQYMIWNRDLADAGPTINGFLNDRVGAMLALVNENNPGCDCETLTTGILADIYQDRLRDDLIAFIESANSIEVFPPRSVSPLDIIDQSIYRHAITRPAIRVTRNIRIGAVYLSTDKLNHFLGIGRRYYTRYQGFLRDGRSPADAEREAILWGILTENTFLGTTTNGIFSFADLESNYQGFRFAQGLCSGSDPFLKHDDSRWMQIRPIDLAAYISPYFDETFLPPLYSELIRKAVHLMIARDYASHAHDGAVIHRFERYRSALPPASPSMHVVVSYLREQQVPSQHPAILEALGLKATDLTAPWDPYALQPEQTAAN